VGMTKDGLVGKDRGGG